MRAWHELFNPPCDIHVVFWEKPHEVLNKLFHRVLGAWWFIEVDNQLVNGIVIEINKG